ncbi:MAG: response regulator [Myxococcales bacterium]|nr:response regulator [Myxococcales bacterium]
MSSHITRSNERVALQAMPVLLLACITLGAYSASARTTTPALSADLLVDRWTVDDGLPLNHLTDLALAPDGSLWLSTYDGLVNFDGHDFEVRRRSTHPGLPSNRFTQVATTRAGQVWAASEGGDLVRLDGEMHIYSPGVGLSAPVLGLVATGGAVWARSRVGWIGLGAMPLSPVGPVGVSLTTLGITSTGEFWSGSDEMGLSRSRPLAGETRGPPSSKPTETHVLGVVDDAVWVGGSELEVHVGDHVRTIRPENGGRFADLCVMTRRPDGIVEVRDRSGWWRIEGDVARPVVPAEDLHCFVTAHMGNVWPWRAAGSRLLRGYERVWEGGHEILGALPAPDGSVWVATGGDGLIRLRPRTFVTLPPPAHWRRPSVESVLVDHQGQLWMGSMVEGLYRTEPPGAVTFSMTRTDGSAPGVLGMVEGVVGPSGEMEIQVGTNVQLCSIAGERCDGFLEPIPGGHDEFLVPLLVDRQKSTWFGGLDHWVNGRDALWVRSRVAGAEAWTEVRDDAGSPVRDARAAVEGADGAVYVATAHHGLVRVRMTGNRVDAVRHIRTADGLSSDRIRSVYPEPGGVIWIGTEDGGLCRWSDGSGPARCLGLEHGLKDDTVHAVLPDDMGRLWLSGNRGISWIRRDMASAVLDGEEPTVLAVGYDERHGMANRECNGGLPQSAVRDAQGRLWFATQNGVVRVDPRDVAAPAHPVVTLKSVLVGGQEAVASLDAEGVLRLDSGQHALAITWTAPDLRHAEDIRFRHRLDGGPWSAPTAERSARWLGLPPGPRLLEVQAGVGGRWSATPLRFTIDRAPTFVETAWFPVSVALFTASLGLLGTLFWSRRQQRARAALELEIARRTTDLAAANDDLARRGREILAQSERLAEVDRVRTRFVADLSHELRTPLALVAGPLEDLARTIGPSLDVPAQKRLAMVLANVTRLDQLSEQLLDVSRLEAGTLPIRVRRREFGAFIDELADRFRPAAELRGLVLAVERESGSCPLYFDRDLIDKVLTNLLGNALKFTEAGTITVTLTLPAVSDSEDGAGIEVEDGFVRVEVRDTGIGIPASVLPKLWGRFFQVDRGDSRRYDGVGIGLALVQELVHLHGGEVGVRSTVGEGSTFWFTLPRGAAHLTLDDVDTSPLQSEADIAPTVSVPLARTEDGIRPTVLVVEDHPDMRAFLALHLSERYAVREASHGEAALASAVLSPPDLIVSDVMMPGMTGLELCARLRADVKLAAIPVILVSAKVAEDDRVAGLEAADDYMTKPIRPRELLARVQRLLSTRRRRISSDTHPVPNAPLQPTSAAQGGPLELDDEAELDSLTTGEVVDPTTLDLASQRQLARMQKVLSDNLADSAFGVIELAAALATSRRQLQRDVRRLTGRSPSEFLRAEKMAAAHRLLTSGARDTVSEVAADVGLSTAYFSRLYSAWFGRAPSDDLARRR